MRKAQIHKRISLSTAAHILTSELFIYFFRFMGNTSNKSYTIHTRYLICTKKRRCHRIPSKFIISNIYFTFYENRDGPSSQRQLPWSSLKVMSAVYGMKQPKFPIFRYLYDIIICPGNIEQHPRNAVNIPLNRLLG